MLRGALHAPCFCTRLPAEAIMGASCAGCHGLVASMAVYQSIARHHHRDRSIDRKMNYTNRCLHVLIKGFPTTYSIVQISSERWARILGSSTVTCGSAHHLLHAFFYFTCVAIRWSWARTMNERVQPFRCYTVTPQHNDYQLDGKSTFSTSLQL